MNKAVFAGSFDPFTLGHKNIVERASAIFDEIVVAIAEDTGKNSRSLELRAHIAKASLSDLKNATIVTFSGLLTDFMKSRDIKVIVRGVRTAADYEYERNLMEVYRSLYPQVEIVLLPAESKFLHISSTVVRQLVKLGAPIKDYMDTKAEKYAEELYKE